MSNYRFVISYALDIEAESVEEAKLLYEGVDDLNEAKDWFCLILDEEGNELSSETVINLFKEVD